MKRIVLSVSTLMVCLAASAQPVINSDVMPEVAESFTLTPFDAVGFLPGDGGEDVTWDYSALTPSGDVVTTVAHDASTIAGSDLFPEANVAWTTDGLGFTFFESNSTNLVNWGAVINDADLGFITAPYSDGEVLMEFPLTYDDDNADSFEGTFSVAGFDVVRSGFNTMEADGYGTLILPSGPVYNVLRVKIEEDYSDEIVLLALTTDYEFDHYYYFVPGFVGPVFQYSYGVVDAMGTITESEVGYYNADFVNIQNILTLDVSVYPNPATEQVVVELPGVNGQVLVSINDLAGNRIWESAVQCNGTFTITPGQLPAGQYLLQVDQDGDRGATWISWQ